MALETKKYWFEKDGFGLRMTFKIGTEKVFKDAINRGIHSALEASRTFARGLAAVRTGSMRAAVYVSSPLGSDYAQVVSAAKSLNPKAIIIPEVVRSKSGAGKLANAVAHSVYNEYGTVHMAPRPFMGPAAAYGRRELPQHIAGEVWKQMK